MTNFTETLAELEKNVRTILESEETPSEGTPPEGGTFHADDFADFLKKTDTTVTVKKEGCMPSPIFGTSDMRNHNKYRVYVQNPKGRVSFVFWDSIANTEKGVPMEINDALAGFGLDVAAFESAPSFEDFVAEFGYESADRQLAQKSFDGCRKQMERAKKMFTDEEISELTRLASEY